MPIFAIILPGGTPYLADVYCIWQW